MKYSSFIILDIETTGVDPATGDIIEFAAVRVDANGKVVGELDLLVGTDQQVNTFVRALTGIQQENLAGKPHIDKLMPTILEFIGDSPIVGHNISFDVDFLNGKGADLTNDLLDTLDLAQTILPKQGGYSLEYLAYKFQFPNQSSHRAMADVLATTDLFYLLIGQMQKISSDTRQKISTTLTSSDWSWLWLFDECEQFVVPEFEPATTDVSKRLLEDVSRVQKDYLNQITEATAEPRAFVETHFRADGLATALAYAASVKPAILCLSPNNFRLPDWAEIAQGMGLTIVPTETFGQIYKEGAEQELIDNLPTLSIVEARLIAKTIIWKTEWKQDYDKLFLTSDERYQWEQKFVDDSLTPRQFIETLAPDIVVTTPQPLLTLGDTAGYHLVITDPLGLEDAAFRNAGKVFSVPYFGALVSSRRDFVHLAIREHDTKLADSLFKLLNDIGGRLTELTQKLVSIFASYPPTNPFDRNLELAAGHLDDELRAQLTDVITSLTAYVDGIVGAKLPDTAKQVEHTEKLIAYLRSILNLDPGYRYFLWADGHRFFLELVPTQPDFSNLGELLDKANGVRILGAGLSYTAGFHYWQTAFPGFAGVILPPDLRAELPVVGDLPDDDNYSHSFAKLAEQFALALPNAMVLSGTSFDGNQVFEGLHDNFHKQGIEIDSHDTIRAVENLPKLYATSERTCIVGYYWWFERARFFVDPVDELLLGKVPFEGSSRPQSKVMQGDFNGFDLYTLPRTVMKFKEVLHQLMLTGKPLVLADSRLFRKDYGRKIMNSCPGVTFVPQTTREVLGGRG